MSFTKPKLYSRSSITSFYNPKAVKRQFIRLNLIKSDCYNDYNIQQFPIKYRQEVIEQIYK
jgi:hypothetical protein